MADYGVTDQGYNPKPYTAIRDDIRTRAQGEIGQNLLTSDDTDVGDLTALVAESNTTIEAKIEAVTTLTDPNQAPGRHLTALCSINGVERQAASYSSTVLTLTGTPGASAAAGALYVPDANNVRWASVATVTLDGFGRGVVTVQPPTTGAITAAAGTLTGTAGLPAGFSSVTNANDATPGTAADTDASLRAKRRKRLARAGKSTYDALYASITAVAGVSDCRIILNNGSSDDEDGRAAGSAEVVTVGGNASLIAKAIWTGAGTMGLEFVSLATKYTVYVTNAGGGQQAIVAGYAVDVNLYVDLTLRIGNGWPSDDDAGKALVIQEILRFASGYTDSNGTVIYDTLRIGQGVLDLKLRGAIGRVAGVEGIDALTLHVTGEAPQTGDYSIKSNRVARFASTRINITVVS